MPASFEAFLTECELGELSLSDSKSSVLSKMGPPNWWDGQGTLSCEQSGVWAYYDLGIVFARDGDGVVKIEVAFRCSGARKGFQLPSNIPSAGSAFDSETTLDEFIEYLSSKSISFRQQESGSETTLLKVADGAVAVFSRKVDYERSMAEEKRIVSDEKQLVSVGVEK